MMNKLARTFGLSLAAIGVVGAFFGTLSGFAPGTAETSISTAPIARTDTPRQTLLSFQGLAKELNLAASTYERSRTSENFARLNGILDELVMHFDFSSIPGGERSDKALVTVTSVLESFERLGNISVDALPNEMEEGDSGRSSYVVPETPFRLEEMPEGKREGEFLFSDRTLRIAPRFLESLRQNGYGHSARNWTENYLQFAGPWIPSSFVHSMPPTLRATFLGTPRWKAGLSAISIIAMFLLVVSSSRFLASVTSREKEEVAHPIMRLLFAGAVMAMLALQSHILNRQIVMTGEFDNLMNLLLGIAFFGTLAAAYWYAIISGAAVLDGRRTNGVEILDQNLTRLIAVLIAFVGAVWILAYGAQTLGFPFLSLLTGLGIGGIAAALAIRPTLENLMGGFILYLDRPIRVGDYCEFGAHEGTIEKIGVRSTQIRALDRTLITVPNAQFADMELINWARCDQMLIDYTVGLRCETDTEQLRYVLASIRRMAHSHPRIDNETVRVRFSGYGPSSLDINIRIYALTREWNDFFAIREDVLFRIKEVIEASGTSFAFPSRTLYFARDSGLDEERTEQAKRVVKRWREENELPFPRFSSKLRKAFDDSLSYPPMGSPDAGDSNEPPAIREEPLATPVDLSDEHRREEKAPLAADDVKRPFANQRQPPVDPSAQPKKEGNEDDK